MYNINSGYVGQSMSVRAKNAYDEGLLSKTMIKKKHLKEYGININVGFLKWLMPDTVVPTEWHHTGKYFNETDFYDLNDVKEQLEELNLEDLLVKFKQEQEEKKKKRTKLGIGFLKC